MTMCPSTLIHKCIYDIWYGSDQTKYNRQNIKILTQNNHRALMLLVGWQEGHLASKNWVVGCWHGYLSGARWRFAYDPADATATHCLLLQ